MFNIFDKFTSGKAQLRLPLGGTIQEKNKERERALDLSTWFRQLDKSTVPNRVLLWNSIQLSFFMKAAFFIRPSSRLWIGSCILLFQTFLQIQLDAFLPCWETEPKPRRKWMNIHSIATVSNEKSSLRCFHVKISHWKKQMRFHGLSLGANIRSINYGHKEVSSGR